MSGNWVDVALVLGMLIVAIAGWRSGVITTAASFAGFIGGALCGAWVIPRLLADSTWPVVMEAMATLGGMFVLGLLGKAILGAAGRAVRDAVDFRPIRVLDSVSGMIVSTLAFLFCAWMVMSVVASSSLGPTSEQVRASRAYPWLDQVMAGPGGTLLADARDLLATIDVPTLAFNSATLPPVADPSDVDVSTAAARAARNSVVQVSTSSSRCATSAMGSGVVVSPGRVVTNAHVVAGAGRFNVRLSREVGVKGARLVYLDPETDVAILQVPGLGAPALQWGSDASRGTAAVVAGYPGGGSLTLAEARVRGQLVVADDSGPGTRDVHVFRGLVRPGNSGGALLGLDGSALGLVFANAQDDDKTGFALTASEVKQAIGAARTATDEVSSGSCRSAQG